MVDDLPFSKKKQLRHKKKERPDHKSERHQQRIDQFESTDKLIYEQVKERSYDWTNGYYRCELCQQRPAEQMHHVQGGAHGRRTTIENVLYICLQCHHSAHGVGNNK